MFLVFVPVLGAVLCGAAAGWLGHRLLCFLRRGVRPPAGCCAGGVAVLWGLLALRWAFGAWTPDWAGPWVRVGIPWWWLPIPAALAWFGVLLATCDLLALRLPNVLTATALPSFAGFTGVGSAASGQWGLVGTSLLGAVLCGGVYLGTRLLVPAALGPGDVKLAPALGMAVGGVSVAAVAVMIAAAAVLTLAGGLLARNRDGVPHGPALLLPAWVLTALGP